MLAKLFLALAFSVTTFGGSVAVADSSANANASDELSKDSSVTESQYVSLCSSWSYESSVRGYICRFQGPSIRIPEERDVERLQATVETLETKLRDLEDRVRRLEAQR